MKSPKTIFVGVKGSFPFRLNNAQNPTTSGVKAITQKGLIDWNNSVLYK